MDTWQLLRASLVYHRRMNVAVALGVAVGTAVLTGALLVGDSVRDSLERLTLDRLGQVSSALVGDRFFSIKLARTIHPVAQERPPFVPAAAPAILLVGTISQPDTGARANHVSLLAGEEAFRLIDPTYAVAPLASDEIDLNEPVATALGVAAGQEVIVRLPTPADIPRDSALGRKTETVTNRRLRVRRIIPATGLGAFSLRPSQATTRLALLPLTTLQEVLRQPGRCNAILANQTADVVAKAGERLPPSVAPTLDDLGLSVTAKPDGYYLLSSSRMLLEPEAESSARKAFGRDALQPVLTYLANTLAVGERSVPYSTVAAIDFAAEPPLGPWLTTAGEPIAPLKDDEIVLNTWAAEQLQAKPGDTVRIDYFEPESTHGKVVERSATFTLRAICALQGPTADRDLTPELPGVTDQLSISDWNPPFPFESSRVRKQDEAYWDEYRATPKAFVALAAGRKLWSSRFGQTTSLRLKPPQGTTVNKLMAEHLAKQWRPDPGALGMLFQPVRQQGLMAAHGTTPFNLLFLGFSMFLIAAALMLVALLFRLSIDERAREIGILRGVGLDTLHVRRLMLGEGLLVAAGGSLSGTVLGVGYAWLMITGLTTWWVAAVSTPFLRLHVTATSLLLGAAIGWLTAGGAIVWSLRGLRRVSISRLLAGVADESPAVITRRSGRARLVAVGCLLLAAVTALSGQGLQGEAQAGAFFGGGSLVLAGVLSYVWSQLSSAASGSLITTGRWPLARLAIRNAARHPGRSTLTMGLVAAAAFLILAISAFHVDPPASPTERNTGTGGYALVAESDQPLYADLDDADGRFDLGFSTQDEQAFHAAGIQALALRVQPGDDASCLNLYQIAQPRVLGATERFIDRGGFLWGPTAATTAAERANPWLLLARWDQLGTLDMLGTERAPAPVVLDFATAVYSLHLSGGVGDRFSVADGRGGRLHLEVVGLLKNSVLQGVLVVSERVLLRYFPEVGGYQFFLIDATPAGAADAARLLNRVLGDYGFDTTSTTERLAGFLAVQNTYLETFQSLGGLGLLLGTLGLAIVELRNVLERRGELALLRATGFRRALLARLVIWENATLLVGGLAIGALAATVALVPHVFAAEASVPWGSLVATLLAVVVAGLAASLLAVRAVLTAPLMNALRSP